jgi:hypothetical protein
MLPRDSAHNLSCDIVSKSCEHIPEFVCIYSMELIRLFKNCCVYICYLDYYSELLGEMFGSYEFRP